MTRGTKIKLNQLLVITISWMILGFVIAIYDHLILHTNNSLGPASEYSFTVSILRNTGAGFIGAMLGGSLLVFFVNVRYRDKPYGYTILFVSISFLLIVAFITVVMGATIVPSQTGEPLADPASWLAFQDFVTDTYPVKNALVWSFIVAITQLLLQVSSKFGHGTFWNIIRGKYNTPKEEKRIIMFLDLNASTTMAEELGDEIYHALLQDFFADITDPIVNNKGSIYQYVGDEVVVAWDYNDGIEDAKCLRCFFDVKFTILDKKEKYLHRYGLIPSFKSGIHCGKVVVGEIGIIKRDITYSGDVLNTTSRIQSMCKTLDAELLVSSNVIEALSLTNEYVIKTLGSIKLRGKAKEVFLNTIKPVNL